MAHNISIENGRASMMYVGKEPWHGLGQKLNGPATAKEAIKAARLDHQVTKKPMIAIDDAQTGKQAHPTEWYAIVRDDLWNSKSCPILGVVSKEYTPLQNSEAFEFFDPIVGEGAAIYHTAGALGDGERIWILAKLPEEIQVVGDDIVDKYLLLSNSHDGKSSVQIKFTPIRVVCQNTLTMALSSGPTIRVTHTRDLHVRLDHARQTLGLVNTRYQEIEETFKRLVAIQVNQQRLDEYLRLVFPDPSDPDNERALDWARKNRMWSEHFFAEGAGNKAQKVRGTLWAAYNGVAELIDHRQVTGGDERRLDSAWFGSGYLTKARAFRVAEEKTAAWSDSN
ncbi:MAG: DUF932 domain-containing protein [Armatimonadetes bacterium]|nr:DUF932 domain-containing protein [Armatimonadota bacterium]